MLPRRAVPLLRATSRRLHRHAAKLQASDASLPLHVDTERTSHNRSRDNRSVLAMARQAFTAQFMSSPSAPLSELPSVEANAQEHNAQVLLKAAKLSAEDFAKLQADDWKMIFASCIERKEDPRRWINQFTTWLEHALPAATSGNDSNKQQSTQLWSTIHAAIRCCLTLHHEQPALNLFMAVTKRHNVPCTDECVFVDVMEACKILKNSRAFKNTYRSMVAEGVAGHAGTSLAIAWARSRLECAFLSEVLDDALAAEYATENSWRLNVVDYNTALKCFTASKQWHSARALCLRMLDAPDVALDHESMMLAIESHRQAPYRDVLELVRRFIEDRHLAPNVQVYTSLLGFCARRRLFEDAAVLWDTMRAQQITIDITAYATMSSIYAASGHMTGIVRILEEMTQHDVTPTALFFDTLLQPLCRFDRIDRCLALLNAMRKADVPVPSVMYESLVRMGTKVGAVPQTLAVVREMARDGNTISSESLLDLVRECQSTSDATELARVFAELHPSGMPPIGSARFSDEVYREVQEQCSRWAPKELVSGEASNTIAQDQTPVAAKA